MKRIVLTAMAVFVLSCQKEDNKSIAINNNKYLVTTTEAQNVAKKFLVSEHSGLESDDIIVSAEVNYDSNNVPASYLVHARYNGKSKFIIVAADKRADEPIIGFGDNDFKLADAPAQLEGLLDSYATDVTAMRQENIESPESIATYNQRVAGFSNSNHAKAGQVLIGPLTTTTWGQGCVYNSAMPKVSSIASLRGCTTPFECDRVFTGCVQTAIAQVVNYYQSMDGYNYNLLQNSYDPDYDLGTRQGAEVSKMMRKIGDIMLASPGCKGTSADCDRLLANNGIKAKLGFTSSLKVSDFNNSDLKIRTEIYNELKAKNLIMISGSDPNLGGGHLWVVDGIRTDSKGIVYLSFNWGWNGTANGWYAYRGTFTGKKYSFTSNLHYFSGIRASYNN